MFLSYILNHLIVVACGRVGEGWRMEGGGVFLWGRMVMNYYVIPAPAAAAAQLAALDISSEKAFSRQFLSSA